MGGFKLDSQVGLGCSGGQLWISSYTFGWLLLVTYWVSAY